MPKIGVNGLQIAYEIIGTGPKAAIITPGGRFPKEYQGIRQLAEKVAEGGYRVVIWDRPNCGESDLCFDGASESILNADTLAGLLRALDLPPALVIGGSAGGRVSLLAAARHPETVERLFLLWLTGGILAMQVLAFHYYHDSWAAAAWGGMEAVAKLPIWQKAIERNSRNRDILMRQDPAAFLTRMDDWSASFIPRAETPIPDMLPAQLRALKMPVMLLRSAVSDNNHPRAVTDAVHAMIPTSRLDEPPWDEREWQQRLNASQTEGQDVCAQWPMLAPKILAFARS